jgi:nucleoside 2-deoxyribosyltransferase
LALCYINAKSCLSLREVKYMKICPVCASNPLQDVQALGDAYDVDCPNCGHYVISGTAMSIVISAVKNEPEKVPLLSYYIRQRTPAVEQTGFALERVSDTPKAGSITNKILVDIRRSKFVLVELTFNNNGAYWEAGYAEGLGKPVIYLCNKAWHKRYGTHFDIRNHFTVFWTTKTLDKAGEELKAAIRATLPDEAIMEDKEPVVA